MSRYEVVSREVYGRHEYILRMLWVVSYFRLAAEFAARPPHAFVPILLSHLLPFDFVLLPAHVFAPILPLRPLPFDSAARPPHVFAPSLLAHLLLEAAARDVQNPIPA